MAVLSTSQSWILTLYLLKFRERCISGSWKHEELGGRERNRRWCCPCMTLWHSHCKPIAQQLQLPGASQDGLSLANHGSVMSHEDLLQLPVGLLAIHRFLWRDSHCLHCAVQWVYQAPNLIPHKWYSFKSVGHRTITTRCESRKEICSEGVGLTGIGVRWEDQGERKQYTVCIYVLKIIKY